MSGSTASRFSPGWREAYQVYQNIIDLLSLAKTKGLTKVGLDSETR